MKTPSIELFQIIKSLSPQEKKYFKQQSRQYAGDREKAYETLFDAIDEQEHYDEEALKKKFADKDFVKQLPVAKNYLTEKILDALLNLYADSLENLLTERMIGRFEILLNRKLIEPAITQFQKVESRAKEKGQITFLPHIARQKNILLSRSSKNYSRENMLQNAEEMVHHAKILLNYFEYEALQLRFNILITDSGFNTNEKIKKELQEIISNPLFKHQDMALSLKAWNYYIKVKLRYAHVSGNEEEAYEICKEAKKYLAKNKTDSDEWRVTSFYQLLDFIEVALSTNNLQESEILVKELQQWSEADFSLKENAKQYFLSFALRLYLAQNKTIEALQFWSSQEKYWNKVQPQMELVSRNNILFQLIRLYFRAKDWKNVISIYHEYLIQKSFTIFLPQVRIYWLMIQYEIGNMELLPNQVRNIKAWYKKENIESDLEKKLFSFFEKVAKAADKHEQKKLFQKLKTQLSAPQEDYLFKDTDLLSWIEANC